MTLIYVRYCVGSWGRRRTDTHARRTLTRKLFNLFWKKMNQVFIIWRESSVFAVFVLASYAASHTSSYFHNLFSASCWILWDTSVNHDIIFNWNMRQLAASAHKYKPNKIRKRRNAHRVISSSQVISRAHKPKERMMGFMLLRLLFLHVSRECIKSKCVISIFITDANIFFALNATIIPLISGFYHLRLYRCANWK